MPFRDPGKGPAAKIVRDAQDKRDPAFEVFSSEGMNLSRMGARIQESMMPSLSHAVSTHQRSRVRLHVNVDVAGIPSRTLDRLVRISA